MAGGSAIAMARNTTPPGASAKVPLRRIWRSRLIRFCLTPASRSVEENKNVRSIDLYAQDGLREVDRSAFAAAAADARHHDHLSHAAEPEHLVHLRRDPHFLPGLADRHRNCAC